MTTRELYMTKKSEVHTPEEFLEAFDNNAVIVFELAKEREPSDKYKLLSGIWDINPDALISEDCDLCVMSVEPTAHTKQTLVIDKGGDKDSGNCLLITATYSLQSAISAEWIMRKKKYKGLVQYENI